jgi:hypothetical protein
LARVTVHVADVLCDNLDQTILQQEADGLTSHRCGRRDVVQPSLFRGRLAAVFPFDQDEGRLLLCKRCCDPTFARPL